MSEDSPRTAFGQRLKGWREAKALSQAAVDEAIEKTRGFTAQIETGRLKPPPREICDKYDAVLQLPAGSVWNAAAPERLRDFDETLWRWHRDQIDAAAGLHITAEEQALLGVVRQLATRSARSNGPPRSPEAVQLALVLESFLADVLVPEEVLGEGGHVAWANPPTAFAHLLADLPSLSHREQQTLWFLFVSHVKAWKTRGHAGVPDTETSSSPSLSDTLSPGAGSSKR